MCNAVHLTCCTCGTNGDVWWRRFVLKVAPTYMHGKHRTAVERGRSKDVFIVYNYYNNIIAYTNYYEIPHAIRFERIIRGVRPLGAHGRGSPGRHLPFWRKLRAHSSVDPRKLYRRWAGGRCGRWPPAALAVDGGSSAPEINTCTGGARGIRSFIFFCPAAACVVMSLL